jgi:8-oxo-dGTP pyrophosphatase MutT (NUDIX family)
MVRRHENLAFMGGAHVFPGGRMDGADCEADETWCAGLDVARTRLPECSPRDSAGFHVAAVRELFEEAGVLLARPGDVGTAAGSADRRLEILSRLRAAAHVHAREFRTALLSARLRLDLAVLTPCAHWITPPRMTRRFDTWFFAARMPEGQIASHDAGETTHGAWVQPDDALRRAAAGTMELPPPTRHTLEELRQFSSVGEAIAWYATHPIELHAPG